MRYTDPDGRFLKKQFWFSFAQATGGVIEAVGGCVAESVTVGVSTYAVIDGIYNAADGVIGMVAACTDKSYDGTIPEVAKAVAKDAGASKETQEMVGAVAGLVDTVVDMKVTNPVGLAKGAKAASKLASNVDSISNAISKTQLGSSGYSAGKAINNVTKKATGKSIYENLNATSEERKKMLDTYNEHH